MKILNLNAGIGGNRKLWGNEHEITAVEMNPKIAEIYQDLFNDDTVIVGDAHQYLLDHYKEFDFIWASPPCQTHSVTNHFLNAQGVIRYPDMKLYQEIIFLKTFFAGLYIIENVKSYYQPLIPPVEMGRHYVWANFYILKIGEKSTIGRFAPVKSKGGKRTEGDNHHKLGFDLSKYSGINKKQVLNNCVSPEIGKHILKYAIIHSQQEQIGLFDERSPHDVGVNNSQELETAT